MPVQPEVKARPGSLEAAISSQPKKPTKKRTMMNGSGQTPAVVKDLDPLRCRGLHRSAGPRCLSITPARMQRCLQPSSALCPVNAMLPSWALLQAFDIVKLESWKERRQVGGAKGTPSS